jgi:kynurenine formamidase
MVTLDISKVKIIDLSTPFDMESSVPQYPYVAKKELFKIWFTNTFPQDGFVDSAFTLGSHVGTHIDAPMHWCRRDEKKGMYTLDDIPLERLFGETVVWDIPKKPALPHGEPITAEDFEKANEILPVREGEILLVHTGWGRFFVEEPKNLYYIHSKGPGLDLSGAEWLVKRKIKAYGQDTMGTQFRGKYSFYLSEKEKEDGTPPIEHKEPVHHLMLMNDIVLIEHLFNLDKVAGKRIIAGFFPLPFKGIEGSPVRALAFLED